MIGFEESAKGRHHRRMNLKVRAIVFHARGVPAEVERWEETDAPEPAADEVG